AEPARGPQRKGSGACLRHGGLRVLSSFRRSRASHPRYRVLSTPRDFGAHAARITCGVLPRNTATTAVAQPSSAPARRTRPKPAPPGMSKAGEECHAHELTREGNLQGRRRDCSKEPDASRQSTLPDWLQSGVQEVVDRLLHARSVSGRPACPNPSTAACSAPSSSSS